MASLEVDSSFFAMNQFVVCALYKFVSLPDYRQMREPLLDQCIRAGVKGSLLLAGEGINGTIAADRAGMDKVLAFLRRDSRLRDLECKESYHDSTPFYRMKVKLKREIVTMGVRGIDPNQVVGTYVSPRDWNALISADDVTVIDTRNAYEVAIGSFEGAIDPGTRTFREFPGYVKKHLDPTKHKKVAMFCTGGIRCEKSTAFLKARGFEEVYHLRGGILNYLKEVPEEESLWRGECFVFDNRVAVDHNLSPGRYELCHGCRLPILAEDKVSEKYIEGVACPHCYDIQSRQQRARFRERQRQIELAKSRNEQHIGAPPPARQYKSR